MSHFQTIGRNEHRSGYSGEHGITFGAHPAWLVRSFFAMTNWFGAAELLQATFPERRCDPGVGSRCLVLEVASLPQIDVRKGMPPVKLSREEFEQRYRSRFIDPVFKPLGSELNAIVNAAWEAYSNSRKSPVTRKAGPGFADPDYEISVDWLAAREAILAAQRQHDDASEKPRILLINGSSRNEHTCPGEMSKTWRLIKSAEPIFEEMGFAVDILDLSRLTSEYGRVIYPCKSCVSTSMALCHWPCSCYPNYSLGQTDDWMNDIYPAGRWCNCAAGP